MKGGFNKILRNIVAGASDTEFEKRLTKATFHLDSKEPKEKHVIYLLESLNGEHKDQVSPIGALKFILERHISNLDNWSITSKVFIVLHRALQNKRVNKKVIRDLKKNEHLLHPYQKKNPDNKYNIRMFMEISKQYAVYMKYYMNTCMKTDIMTKPRKGFSEEVRKLNITEILKNYEYFEGLSTQIFDLFQHTNFCKQTRLFSNVIFMLLKDLMEIYRIYYTHITEILERFPNLNKADAQKAFVMYQNFVNLTEAIKNKANKLIYIFNFPITLPEFYNPERGLIDTLRVVVSQAGADGDAPRSEEQQNKVKAASAQLKSGMKAIEEAKQGEVEDAITDMYFDCNALDRMTEQEPSQAPTVAPEEELKMDKDLGLFEMINAGDFSTVTNQEAAAVQEEVKNQSNTFDFGAADDNSGSAAAQQTPQEDLFDFGQAPREAAKTEVAAQKPPSDLTNDLFDVFSTNPAPGNNDTGANTTAADPLADIFAQGSQPLIPTQQQMPGNNKMDFLNSFYTEQQNAPSFTQPAAGSQGSAPNQFQTQQNLPGTDPFSQMMGNGAPAAQQQQPASGGFQPMPYQPMMQQNQMTQQMGQQMNQMFNMMAMNTNQPQQQLPGGSNPFDAFGGPQQQPAMGNFGTAPQQMMQQQQPNQQPAAQNQQQAADPFNFM